MMYEHKKYGLQQNILEKKKKKNFEKGKAKVLFAAYFTLCYVD